MKPDELSLSVSFYQTIEKSKDNGLVIKLKYLKTLDLSFLGSINNCGIIIYGHKTVSHEENGALVLRRFVTKTTYHGPVVKNSR